MPLWKASLACSNESSLTDRDNERETKPGQISSSTSSVFTIENAHTDTLVISARRPLKTGQTGQFRTVHFEGAKPHKPDIRRV